MTRPAPFAALSPAAARRTLAFIVFAAILLAAAAHLAPAEPRGSGFAPLVEALRAGADFYTAAGDLAQAGEAPPMPLLPLAVAPLSGLAFAALVAVLASALLWTGVNRLADGAGGLATQVAAAALLLAGTAAAALLDPPLGVAALLVAWSLFLRRPRHWVEAAALGSVAALVHAPALAYPLVMAAAAGMERARREAAGWLLAAAVPAAALACHLHALARTGAPPFALVPDPSAPARLVAAALPLLPPVAGAALVVLALLGWAARGDPVAPRLFALAAAVLLLATLTGADAAPLAAAPLLAGLAFAPAALRTLVRRARARHRITVTRLAREEP